jgi:hypothetical protein
MAIPTPENQNNNKEAKELKILPEDTQDLIQDARTNEDYVNPITSTRSRKTGELILKWAGPEDAVGFIGHPYTRQVRDEKNTYLYDEVLEGVLENKLYKIADVPDLQCVAVVRNDVYKTS